MSPISAVPPTRRLGPNGRYNLAEDNALGEIYQQAAALAKEAFASGKSIREVCREKKVLPVDELETVLDAQRRTRPGF